MLKSLNCKLGKVCLSAKIFGRIVPSRLYYKVFLNSFRNTLRLYTPSSAVIGLTYRCQCKCVHCSAGLYKKDTGKELSTKEWLSLLDDIAGLGVPRVNITGGEAFLREDLFEIIRYAAKKFIVILESNGLLLTEDNVKKLKRAGLSCVAVSLDSYDPLLHDRLRNLEGCFKQAVAGISRVIDNKMGCILSTYVVSQRADADTISRIMKLARQLRVMAVRVMPSRPVGSFSCHTDALLNREEEKNVLRLIDPYIAYFKGIPAPKQCGIFCKATFYISPYGEVQPCPYLPLVFGETKKDPLADILDRMWRHNIFNRTGKDCLILNQEFRGRVIDPYLKGKRDEAIFPLAVDKHS